MQALILVKGLILCSSVFVLKQCSASIDNELLQVHFEYPGPAISERDLPVCPPNAVCSVLHNRYWMSPIVKRLCRCLRRIECPWKWTNYPDNNTMHLDNRSQFKFCDEVSELQECGLKKVALTVTTTATSEVKHMRPSQPIEEERKLAVNASCFCPASYIWEEQPEKLIIGNPDNGTSIITHYMCKPMAKCSSFEFCGNIRADYFSIYYRCSCPVAHMCLDKNRTLTMSSELLYDGQVYQAFCHPQ